MTTWLQHVDRWGNCQRCPLSKQRDRICFARSDWPQGQDRPNLRLPCDVLFVGEAPGKDEDAHGLPFIGPAGRRMDLIIDRALPTGTTYALTNLVLCYPREAKERGENEPERGEIFECRPRLVEFVNIAQPRLIVRVGKLVTSYLAFDSTVPYIDIVHPAWILRQVVVKQHSETNRCVVQIKNALQDVLKEEKKQWKYWGEKDAKQQKYEDYDELYGEIPF